eukprot:TRINITY_DN1246_c0_g1_i1.p2 TRINITY_DN1246_c0_g1~~TRINITY_DN1246_c0_g1_i1.p2  ORF type:complete len:107 (+),score=27.19 TRINITY_DN1246_c0_g1_i1:46-366(+)
MKQGWDVIHGVIGPSCLDRVNDGKGDNGNDGEFDDDGGWQHGFGLDEPTRIMLFKFMDELNKKRIILASTSPRRKDLLEQIGMKFEMRKSGFAEDLDKGSFEAPAE